MTRQQTCPQKTLAGSKEAGKSSLNSYVSVLRGHVSQSSSIPEIMAQTGRNTKGILLAHIPKKPRKSRLGPRLSLATPVLNLKSQSRFPSAHRHCPVRPRDGSK